MTRTGIMRTLAVSALATVCLLPIARAHADVVTDWNVIALNATAVPPNSILQSRALAIVHGAIYDAVRAVDRKGGAYAIDVEAPAGTSVEAAVVAAAHGTLVRLAPAERPMLDAALNVSLSKIADGQGKTDGTALGQQIAEKTRGAAQHRWRRREGRVHREARHWPLSAHPAPIAARDPGAMGLGHAIRAAQQVPVST